MLAAYPLTVALAAASDGGWWGLPIIVSGALATIGLGLTARSESSPAARVQAGFAGTLFLVAALAATAHRPELQLLVAILALVPLLFGSFWQASAEWKRRRGQLEAPPASPRGTASSSGRSSTP